MEPRIDPSLNDYALEYIEKPGYIHVIVTGRNTAANVRAYTEEVILTCAASGHRRVLVEKRLDGRSLATGDVFDIVARGSQLSVGLFSAVAFVDIHGEDEMVQFAETVAYNRGVPMAAFRDVALAERWMAQAIRADAEEADGAEDTNEGRENRPVSP